MNEREHTNRDDWNICSNVLILSFSNGLVDISRIGRRICRRNSREALLFDLYEEKQEKQEYFWFASTKRRRIVNLIHRSFFALSSEE